MRTSDRHEIVAPEVTLRIPGAWSGRRNLLSGCRAAAASRPRASCSSMDRNLNCNALPADEEFPRIFAGSCPKLPTESEREQIEDYKVNICLTGRGGSIEAAKRLMAAAGGRAGGGRGGRVRR